MVILQSVPVQIVIKVSNLNPLVKFLWRWTTNMARKSDKNLILLNKDFIKKYEFNYIKYLSICCIFCLIIIKSQDYNKLSSLPLWSKIKKYDLKEHQKAILWLPHSYNISPIQINWL